MADPEEELVLGEELVLEVGTSPEEEHHMQEADLEEGLHTQVAVGLEEERHTQVAAGHKPEATEVAGRMPEAAEHKLVVKRMMVTLPSLARPSSAVLSATASSSAATAAGTWLPAASATTASSSIVAASTSLPTAAEPRHSCHPYPCHPYPCHP